MSKFGVQVIDSVKKQSYQDMYLCRIIDSSDEDCRKEFEKEEKPVDSKKVIQFLQISRLVDKKVVESANVYYRQQMKRLNTKWTY